MLLRPLPFPEADRLVVVRTTHDVDEWGSMSAPDFEDVRAQNRVFTEVAAFHYPTLNLTGHGEPVQLQAAGVTSGFFDVLGVPPALGRAFREDESEPGRSALAILGHRLWRQRFGGDPGIVGRTVTLDGRSTTVVGVAPAGFEFPKGTELWTPVEYDDDWRDPENRRAEYLNVIARLKPGVPLERAHGDVSAIAARLQRQYPKTNTGVGARVQDLHERVVGDIRTPLLVLLGAVGLVLLIACANVGNLLLARAAAREGEIAVRAALGAGRSRILRQLFTESLVLGVIGAGLGLLVAIWGTQLLLRLEPQGIPRLEEVGVDATVLAFTAALALVTALAFGALPALQVVRGDLGGALKQGGRGALAGRRGVATRSALVVTETALAVLLLVGAGLLLRSFVRLLDVDPGFRPESTVAFELGLPEASYEGDAEVAGFQQRLLESLRALPGVRSVGAITGGLPLTGGVFVITFDVDGRPVAAPGEEVAMQVRVVTPGYFEAMGIPVRRGRAFTDDDRQGAPQVVVLSDPAVRRFFPSEEALGRGIRLGWTREDDAGEEVQVGGEVVGIVGGVKQIGLADPHEPEVYVPMAQAPTRVFEVVVRASGDPAALAGALRREVHALDPTLPVSNVRTLEEIVRDSVSQPRFYLLLLAIFAAVALVLAAIGVFGVLSYAVAQRTREIGIRMALGAAPAGVRREVVWRALALAGAGLAIGLFGALALTRLLSGLLYGVSPTDPATFAAVAGTLAAVAGLASWLPARSATRVDPVTALRAE